jgi:exodeoxyribonuclease-3
MKLFSWNVNGIRAVINKGEFKKFIDTYAPDVLCIQETKAKKGQADIDLPDYAEYWNDADRAGYSGTAIFIKNNVIGGTMGLLSDRRRFSSGKNDPEMSPRNDALLNVTYGFSENIMKKYDFKDTFGDAAREGRVTTAEFENFFLVTQYTPNAKNPDLGRLKFRRDVWDPAFLEYVKELETTKPVIFCGDLNVAYAPIDLARPKDNVGGAGFTREERAGFGNYLKAGFYDTFRIIYPEKTGAYTWWTWRAKARERNVGWRIDYFLVSSALKSKVEAAEIYPEQLGSDHCPISLTFDI